jgi:hypothetical protein
VNARGTANILDNFTVSILKIKIADLVTDTILCRQMLLWFEDEIARNS